MTIHIICKQFYILGPLEVYLHFSSLKLYITDVLIVIFPNPKDPAKPLASNHGSLSNSPFNEHNGNQLYHLNFCPLEGLFFFLVLQVHFSGGLYCCRRSLLQCTTMRKSHLQIRIEHVLPQSASCRKL